MSLAHNPSRKRSELSRYIVVYSIRYLRLVSNSREVTAGVVLEGCYLYAHPCHLIAPYFGFLFGLITFSSCLWTS